MILVMGSLLLLTRAWGATVVSGNVSGTWTTNGSPYILSADCTVASNQTLTIQPGVEAIVGPGSRLLGAGAITAIGTPEAPITFRGASPTNYWRGIFMELSGFTNRFYYCRLSDANEAALQFDVAGRNRVVGAEVINCEFSNCERAVLAAAEGQNTNQPLSGSATFTAAIHNCVFDSSGYGCMLITHSASYPGNATAHAKLTGNIFRSLRYSAFVVSGTGTNISRPIFMNNTVVNANDGVAVWAPFEPVIRNNIFLRTSSAVIAGTTTPDTSYNCFYNNTANFVGYPGIYGVPVQNNHNGDPCDAFFNIFLDPQFIDTNHFLLSNSSPCIDAGDPAIADVCFQFSHGSAISDIGAYGGPEACGWLTHGFAPVITSAPQDQTSCVGGSASFKVRVEGSEPLSYQWSFNGTNLLNGETNAQLNLVNLQTNQAGFYSVTVSNSFGSVSSPLARLLVFDACVGIHLYAGLSITGIVGRTYTVDYVTNLAAMNWTVLASNTFSQPKWLFIDTNTPFDAKKFFRVRLEP
jgi:hypothetical protein